MSDPLAGYAAAAPGLVERFEAVDPDILFAPVRDLLPELTIADASRSGLILLRRVEADSVPPGNRAMGVRWTWLAFGKQPSNTSA
ncbi:MAG: hypothetical protein KIT81_12830 [Alphaproteobacteria bacterium]|nr:hypothetical protein [Alphaproteobacteria bacterium]